MTGETRTLLYLFREKVELEVVGRWDARRRMHTLELCCATTVYQVDSPEKIYVLSNNGLRIITDLESVPNEIKLAAMLVN